VRALYGYSIHDVQLPQLSETKEEFKMERNSKVRNMNRTPVQVNLGVAARGFALPQPSPDCPETVALGIEKRFASKPPDIQQTLLQEFAQFVQVFVEKEFTPLSPNSDTTTPTWLAGTTYPEWRRKELLEIEDKYPIILKKHFNVKGFPKDEPYLEYKHIRIINARHDRFKVEVGPTFKLIENQVYKSKYFIKHVPVAERPLAIRQSLMKIGARYFITDFSTFEASFVKKIMHSCEFILYKHMTKFLPNAAHFHQLLENVLAGKNTIYTKFWKVLLEATRMSGEMCTSLGNGFSNLMLVLFVAHKSGCIVDGKVEGDDGIWNELSGNKMRTDLFASLGFSVKWQEVADLCKASFCGIIFDPDECIAITDPIKVLASFGWTCAKYARAGNATKLNLIRCKSLSLFHQYPGCPIISSLASYGLRITKGRDVRHFVNKMQTNEWNRNKLLDALKVDVHKHVATGFQTRLLVEQVFKIPVEIQLAVEAYLDNLDTLQELRLPYIDMFVNPDMADYWNRYQVGVIGEDPTVLFRDITQ